VNTEKNPYAAPPDTVVTTYARTVRRTRSVLNAAIPTEDFRTTSARYPSSLSFDGPVIVTADTSMRSKGLRYLDSVERRRSPALPPRRVVYRIQPGVGVGSVWSDFRLPKPVEGVCREVAVKAPVRHCCAALGVAAKVKGGEEPIECSFRCRRPLGARASDWVRQLTALHVDC
jgi:hypothetical protein